MIAFFSKLSNVKKLVVFVASQIVSASVDAHLIPDRYAHYVQLTVFFLTSVGIYAARNAKPTAATVVAAAAEDASTVASGELPSLDELQAELASLKDVAAPDAPKHAAFDPDPAVTQPLPVVPA